MRGRPGWPDAKIERLCGLLAAAVTFEEAADQLEVSRNAIAGQVNRMRQKKDPRLPKIQPRGRRRGSQPRKAEHGGPLRRFAAYKPSGRGVVLAGEHPAVRDGTTLFPSRVVHASVVETLLKSALHQRKIGKTVMRGAWAGMPVYTLTLEERRTCPRTCPVWSACYGNNMHFSERVIADEAFEIRLISELVALNERHRDGFVVRLHILGDFYSPGYVDLWGWAMRSLPALRVFGYTARRRRGAIGNRVMALNESYPDRWVIRFSGHAGAFGSIVIESKTDKPASAFICPSQTGQVECCATCAACWQPGLTPRAVAFLRH